MQLHVLTLFVDLFAPFKQAGVLGRAVDSGLISLEVHDLRDWAQNKWRQLDDEPYGGGAGMVIQAPPVLDAVRQIRSKCGEGLRTLMLTPRGRVFDQHVAAELASQEQLLLICGRYEGFDERALELLQPEELSVGDFVLGGGEVAAMAIIEAVTRLVPGVVGDPRSVEQDSFAEGLLDYPCYTRPAEVEGLDVPAVLLSGHHERIRRWRLEESVRATVTRRPDLIKKNWDRYSREVRALVRRFDLDLASQCVEAVEHDGEPPGLA